MSKVFKCTSTHMCVPSGKHHYFAPICCYVYPYLVSAAPLNHNHQLQRMAQGIGGCRRDTAANGESVAITAPFKRLHSLPSAICPFSQAHGYYNRSTQLRREVSALPNDCVWPGNKPSNEGTASTVRPGDVTACTASNATHTNN
ncbi:hypothetical protein SUGI_0911610 [Cryptomeria japonica]|nr:hypothetical protein SUGI_0911610 [Cryptomeria japonica]